MRRLVLTLLAVAALTVGTVHVSGGTVSADKGGNPNPNACHGQIVSAEAREGAQPGRVVRDPDIVAEIGVTNAGDLNKLIRAGIIYSTLVPQCIPQQP